VAGALGTDAGTIVRRAIRVTVDRLQRSSISPHSPGHRYARLLHLLWRKSPETNNMAVVSTGPDRQPLQESRRESQGTASEQPPGRRGTDVAVELDPLNGFSWRDLDAVGQYLANDASVAESNISGLNYESEGVGGVLDAFTGDWYDNVWSANDIVF
jgi:hypothetical protein